MSCRDFFPLLHHKQTPSWHLRVCFKGQEKNSARDFSFEGRRRRAVIRQGGQKLWEHPYEKRNGACDWSGL